MPRISEPITNRATERLIAPDLLRGVGLALLLLTNVPLILTPIRYQQAAGANLFGGSPADDIATFLFLSIPTMAGMGMFVLAMSQGLSRAGDSNQAFRAAVIRLVVIGAIGILHALLIWWGDILVYYLIAGVIALYFRGRPPVAQMAIGASVMMLPLILAVADFLGRFGANTSVTVRAIAEASAGFAALEKRAFTAYTSQDPGLVLHQRISDLLAYMQDFAFVGLPQLVGLMLVGIGIARHRRSNPRAFQSPRIGLTLRVATFVAVAAYLAQLTITVVVPNDPGPLGGLAVCCQVFAPPALAVIAYVAAIRHEDRLRRSRTVRFWCVAGRYSLSLYIGTSLLCAAFAYGLGYYGSFSQGPTLAITAAVAIVLACSFGFLFVRGKQGPLESLVRMIATTHTMKHTSSRGRKST